MSSISGTRAEIWRYPQELSGQVAPKVPCRWQINLSGGCDTRIDRFCEPDFESFWLLLALWACGRRRAVPVLRSDTGAAQPVRGADRPHVHRAAGRQAVSGGPAGLIEELAVAGIAGEAARAMEDGQGFIGIVMDAHRGLDEVGPQRALRQLQGEAVVAHGVVVADDALFLD